MVSRTYPAYHPKKGQPTYFVEKILARQFERIDADGCDMCYQSEEISCVDCPYRIIGDSMKFHTFRGNFPLWKKRIDEVLSGNAVIVLKYHTLGRYVKGNKQIEFLRLDKESGIGVEEIYFHCGVIEAPNFIIRKENKKPKAKLLSITEISKNDGLDFIDYKNWFEKGDYDLKETFACIQFTSFRYGSKTES